MKVEQYKLTKEQKVLIKSDEANKKVWGEAMESLSLGPVRMPVFIFGSLRETVYGNNKAVN